MSSCEPNQVKGNPQQKLTDTDNRLTKKLIMCDTNNKVQPHVVLKDKLLKIRKKAKYPNS